MHTPGTEIYTAEYRDGYITRLPSRQHCWSAAACKTSITNMTACADSSGGRSPPSAVAANDTLRTLPALCCNGCCLLLRVKGSVQVALLPCLHTDLAPVAAATQAHHSGQKYSLTPTGPPGHISKREQAHQDAADAGNTAAMSMTPIFCKKVRAVRVESCVL